jgi:hypothetical protein
VISYNLYDIKIWSISRQTTSLLLVSDYPSYLVTSKKFKCQEKIWMLLNYWAIIGNWVIYFYVTNASHRHFNSLCFRHYNTDQSFSTAAKRLSNMCFQSGDVKVKVKLSLCFNWAPCHESILGEWRYSFTHSLTSALDAGEWSASCPGCFTPSERAPGTHWIGGWVGPMGFKVVTVVKV